MVRDEKLNQVNYEDIIREENIWRRKIKFCGGEGIYNFTGEKENEGKFGEG